MPLLSFHLISAYASDHCALRLIRPPFPEAIVSAVRAVESSISLACSRFVCPSPQWRPSSTILLINQTSNPRNRIPQPFPCSVSSSVSVLPKTLSGLHPVPFPYVGPSSHELPLNVGVAQIRLRRPSILGSTLTSSSMACIHNCPKDAKAKAALLTPVGSLSSLSSGVCPWGLIWKSRKQCVPWASSPCPLMVCPHRIRGQRSSFLT
jgi:hypothetical protein